LIQNNDILIYKFGAYVGNTTLFREGFPFEYALVNEHVFLMRAKKKEIQEYLLLTLMQSSYYDIMQSLGQKAAQPGLNQDDLKNVIIIIPNDNIIKRFNSITSTIFEKLFLLAKESSHLASLRDWLLPMLMNGQVGFKNTSQAKETSLSVAAEPEVIYKKSSTQADNYHKIQSTYTIIWANNLVGVQQGEMALAKDLYLVDRIFGVNTGYSYAQHNWGSFDPTFKQTINNKQYFEKKNFDKSKACYWDLKDNGKLLDKIPTEMKEQIKSGIELLHNKVFHQYTYGKKPEMKELFATVLKCIEDTKSTELSVIREEMKRWKTPKQKFPDKAAKFSEQQTKDALDVILREGWHKNVMK
jgi:hypothetical protein